MWAIAKRNLNKCMRDTYNDLRMTQIEDYANG